MENADKVLYEHEENEGLKVIQFLEIESNVVSFLNIQQFMKEFKRSFLTLLQIKK